MGVRDYEHGGGGGDLEIDHESGRKNGREDGDDDDESEDGNAAQVP